MICRFQSDCENLHIDLLLNADQTQSHPLCTSSLSSLSLLSLNSSLSHYLPTLFHPYILFSLIWMPCSDIPLSRQMPFCSLSSHHSLPLLIPHGWYHSRKIIKPGCLVSWCTLPHCCSTRLTLICRRCPHSLGGLLPASNYPTFLTPQPFYAHFTFAGTFVGHNFLLPIKISLYFSFSSLLLY